MTQDVKVKSVPRTDDPGYSLMGGFLGFSALALLVATCNTSCTYTSAQGGLQAGFRTEASQEPQCRQYGERAYRRDPNVDTSNQVKIGRNGTEVGFSSEYSPQIRQIGLDGGSHVRNLEYSFDSDGLSQCTFDLFKEDHTYWGQCAEAHVVTRGSICGKVKEGDRASVTYLELPLSQDGQYAGLNSCSYGNGHVCDTSVLKVAASQVKLK